MFNFFSESDFGGWLLLFQMRLYTSILNLIFFSADTVVAVIFVAMLAICLALFYMRKRTFRIVYMIIAGLIIFINIAALPDSLLSLIAQAVVEAVVITALFRSERVNSAFF
jgi:hypothetical protein